MADENLRERSVFISYSHKDKDRVLPLASYLVQLGIKVWIDEKDLDPGVPIVEAVSAAIKDADLYIIALSEAFYSSKWLAHELNTALSLEISQGRPVVVPILLSKSTIPPALISRLYIDLSNTADSEVERRLLGKMLQSQLPELVTSASIAEAERSPFIRLAAISLQLRAKTRRWSGVSGFDEYRREEVDEEAADLVRTLRRRANGVLLNFVSAGEIDLSSPYARFPNGDVTSTIVDSDGDFVGTITREAIVEVQVLNPSEIKLEELVSSKLESLGVSRATYTFVLSPPLPNLAKSALVKLQKEYVILGWDPEQGADVELPDDLKLSVSCSDSQIRIGIETKYSFQFQKRAKEFSVRGFVSWLIA